MQSSELQPDCSSLKICPIPFEQKEFNFDEIEQEQQQEPLKRTDNHSSSYIERQTNINAG